MDNILSRLQSDLTQARAVQVQVLEGVAKAYRLYDGNQYTDESGHKNRITYSTNFKQRDIQRTVESSLPDIVSAFVTDDDIAVAKPKNGDSKERAEVMTLLLNQQFSKGIDKLDFIETIGRNIQIEGTVFTKVGWGDNQPLIENIPINEIFIDPSARKLSDARFVIQRSKVSVSDIKSNTNWYGSHDDDVYGSLEAVNATQDDVNNFEGYGRDDSFNFEDRPRQLIEVFEYYGLFPDDNGELVPVLAIWSDDTLLRFGDSPYPESFKGIPFEVAIYTRKPYSVYGSGVADLLETSQNLRQSIMTGMVENINNNTAGQTFLMKNSLDMLNKKRFMNGHRYVETNGNPNEIMTKGSFVDMPQSVFAMSESLKAEQEELTGISRLNTGLDPRALNSGVSATAIQTSNSNAAKRLLQITRHIAEMLERVFYKWVDLNQEYLEQATVQDAEANEFIPVDGSMIQGEFDISIKAGVAGQKQEKIQNMQMMMSMLSTQQLPPQVNMAMLGEMASLLELPKLGDVLAGLSQQEPNPEEAQLQQAQMSLDMAEKQAGIEKDQAKAMLDKAKAMESYVSTERASYARID